MTEVITMAPAAASESMPDEVITDGDSVTIRLTTYNPAVREALQGHQPVARTHQMLDVGAQALHGAGASAEAEAMGAQVERLKTELHQAVNDTCEQLNTRTDALFGEEEGTVASRITATVQEVERLLGATFDADSKSSAIAKIETAMQATVENLQNATRRQLQAALDPESDGLWARSLKGLLERFDNLERSTREVSEKVAASQAASAMHDRTAAIKGLDYEEIIDKTAGDIAAAQGDVLEHVGTTNGALERRAGDFVVTLNPNDQVTGAGRYVIEAQDQTLTLGKTRAKAQAAKDNREASAAVMVFSSQQQAPTSVPFVPFGDVAIVVLDKHAPDPLALKVAMGWARAAVRLDQNRDNAELDHEHVEQAVDRARRGLEKVSTVKRCFTAAGKAAREGREHVDALAEEVHAALNELDALTRGTLVRH